MRSFRFRIKEKDTIKATVSSVMTRKILASVYDSGFTTISEIEAELIRKIPHFEGKEVLITITNIDKEESKQYTIKTN